MGMYFYASESNHTMLIKASITDAVQSCRNEVNSLNVDAQDLVNKVKQDFQLLRDNIKTEQSLTNQITEHCTAKAVLEEKGKTSDAALQELAKKLPPRRI